jgi:nifR3 family TIM-barrel protein
MKNGMLEWFSSPILPRDAQFDKRGELNRFVIIQPPLSGILDRLWYHTAMNDPQAKPTFTIRDIPIYGHTILSPMDGYSDQPFRALARRLGSAISYTEFINAIDVLYGHPHLERKLAFLESERPVAYQVFDDDPDRLVQAVLKLRPRNPDIIDINMGCSARCVSGRGAGAGLLRTPEKIAAIFRRLSSTLDIPVTGKIRLGWDGSTRNYLDIARIIEDNGGQMIAVHGRTRAQSYSGSADWDAIAEVRQAVSIPVIANGDIKTVADIRRAMAHTGCPAVMIARAAIGNPWIFAGLDREEVTHALLRETMVEHLQQMQSFYGPHRGLILFRKYAARYITPYGLSSAARQSLLTSSTLEDFLALFDQSTYKNQQPALSLGSRSGGLADDQPAF